MRRIARKSGLLLVAPALALAMFSPSSADVLQHLDLFQKYDGRQDIAKRLPPGHGSFGYFQTTWRPWGPHQHTPAGYTFDEYPQGDWHEPSATGHAFPSSATPAFQPGYSSQGTVGSPVPTDSADPPGSPRSHVFEPPPHSPRPAPRPSPRPEDDAAPPILMTPSDRQHQPTEVGPKPERAGSPNRRRKAGPIDPGPQAIPLTKPPARTVQPPFRPQNSHPQNSHPQNSEAPGLPEYRRSPQNRFPGQSAPSRGRETGRGTLSSPVSGLPHPPEQQTPPPGAAPRRAVPQRSVPQNSPGNANGISGTPSSNGRINQQRRPRSETIDIPPGSSDGTITLPDPARRPARGAERGPE